MCSREARGAHEGFTLVELSWSYSLILADLGTARVAQYKHSVQYARKPFSKDLFNTMITIDQFTTWSKGRYPEESGCAGDRRVDAKVPVDPITNSAERGRQYRQNQSTIQPLPERHDVISGSDKTALDGTKYSEWR
jgi:hypothetical protein